MPARKKRWGEGSLEYQASELGERLYAALDAGEEAYWKAVQKLFPEVPRSEPYMGFGLEVTDGVSKAIFEWLKHEHPDPELVSYLEAIFGREMTPEEHAAWMEKLKRWGKIP